MCRIFNEEKVLDRAGAGLEFGLEIVDKPKQNPFRDSNGRWCTINRNYYIRDSRFLSDDPRHEVARVHMHITETGEIGASGKPDPKEMIIHGVEYRGRGFRRCELCENGDMIPPDQRFFNSTYGPF
jgi:hypothetical protein